MSKRRETSDEISQVIDIRIRKEVLARAERIWKAGARADESRSAFLGYLVKVGLAQYERKILPVELGEADDTVGPPTEVEPERPEQASGDR